MIDRDTIPSWISHISFSTCDATYIGDNLSSCTTMLWSNILMHWSFLFYALNILLLCAVTSVDWHSPCRSSVFDEMTWCSSLLIITDFRRMLPSKDEMKSSQNASSFLMKSCTVEASYILLMIIWRCDVEVWQTFNFQLVRIINWIHSIKWFDPITYFKSNEKLYIMSA